MYKYIHKKYHFDVSMTKISIYGFMTIKDCIVLKGFGSYGFWGLGVYGKISITTISKVLLDIMAKSILWKSDTKFENIN